jgi:predicted metal-dependent hydrolase
MAASVAEQLQLPFHVAPGAAGNRRHILLGSRVVPYVFSRGRRRRLSMVVDHRGLRVGAPLSAPFSAVEDFLRANADWILRKLDAWSAESGPRRLLVCDGARLPVLGEDWTLRIARGADRVVWGDGWIDLQMQAGSDPAALLGQGLRQRALALFLERVASHREALGGSLPLVSLSNAQTRWGSCSRKTGVRFNWRLIHLPPDLVDYVVAHELAHLEEMNHSPRFWRAVERYFPDYRQARQALRRQAAAIPQF